MSPRQMLAGTLVLLMAATASAQTQDTNNVATNSVGNPQLRDFELPGTRVTPPARPPEATTQPVTIPAPAAPPPPRAGSETGIPEPRPEASTSAQRRTPRAAAPLPQQDRRTEPPAAAPSRPAPASAAPVSTAPADTTPIAPGTVGEAPQVSSPAAEPAPVPAPAAPASNGDIPWLYFGLAALASLVALLVFFKVRQRAEADETPGALAQTAEAAAEPRPEPIAARAPEPAPAAPAVPVAEPPKPVTSGFIGIQLRPWIELEFRPARAAATPTEANVQFELVVRNTGTSPARNVRIEVRMFNAGHGQEQEIEAFYGEPIRERTSPALETLAAKGEVKISSAVAMPNENVRELTVQGRRLFIPTVAFNVVYEWGNAKSGQTSASYLVGREAETPAEKMGAFRLDLGPRLYRSVGQRPMRLARAT